MLTDSSCNRREPYSSQCFLQHHRFLSETARTYPPADGKGGEHGRDEGAEKGKKGSQSEASMNRASWAMDKECVYVQACVVRVSLGETWEASCLCRSAKQKEPLPIHPHIPYFSFVPFSWFCLWSCLSLFNIVCSTDLLPPRTAFLALT